jgi:methionyl-tRNA formyltransferase
MKILAFVSKDIGLSFLKLILDNDDDIFLVIGNENRKEIIDVGKKYSIPYICIEDFEFSDYEEEFDWLLNLWSPYIFSDEILARVKHSLNIHPSLLPLCRGRDPIVHGLLNQEKLGFTFHSITKGVDEGPIIFQKEVKYEFPYDASLIYNKIINEAISSFRLNWPIIRLGKSQLIEQAEGVYQTYTRKMTESLRLKNWIDLSRDQIDLLTWISSFDFKNGYGPILEIDDKRFRISIEYSRIEEDND